MQHANQGTTGFNAYAVAERAARESFGRLTAALAARFGDVAAAEDALGEALARALQRWPADGVPDNPEAWLATVARRLLLDEAASARSRLHASDDVARALGTFADRPNEIGDERLAMLYACAHPGIDPSVRGPLMLSCVLGLDAAAIARRFLVSPAAMQRRLSRGKLRLRDAGIRFEVPGTDDLAGRTHDVLQAIYTAFTAAHDDEVIAGSSVGPLPATQPALAGGLAQDGSLELARTAAQLLPGEPEAHGLRSLIASCVARCRARRSAEGAYLPLDTQDPALWDPELLREASESLVRASRAGPTGRFQIEAAIQCAHTARITGSRENRAEIVALYDVLLRLAPSIGAAVARAAAIAERDGPEEGLRALEWIRGEPALRDYQPYAAVRALLLARMGRTATAAEALDRALGLTADAGVRAYLKRACARR